MKASILLILLLLCIPAVFAQDMTLLAVQETSQGLVGGSAQLTIEIQDGQGRVFLETAPLTKIDTQVSTRFAQQVACNYLSANCDAYDFIYTIRSNSPIVGGPSAGAAMTILTIAELEDIPLDRRVAITGTINSGGIIGPVGGVKQKVEAAAKKRITTVLIPRGEASYQEDNQTIDVIAYGKTLGVEVVEVDIIDAAIPYFFGKELREQVDANLVIDPQYQQIMGDVARELCSRSQSQGISIDSEEVLDLLERANESLAAEEYYSAASRCFNANIKITTRLSQDLSAGELLAKIDELQEKIASYQVVLDEQEQNTIPQLQTYMLVQERLSEAELIAANTKVLLINKSDNVVESYAFAEERYASAIAWSKFFEKSGRALDFSKAQLQQGCQIKIEEADERIQYISTFYPGPINGLQESIAKARDESREEKYELCLNTASLVKARADTLIGSQGLASDEQVRQLVETKLAVAERRIIEEQARDVFPIAGYAYYEYARSLEEESPGSALLYSQYALELSSFDLYFTSPSISNPRKQSSQGYELLLVYAMGLLCGAAIAFVVFKFQE